MNSCEGADGGQRCRCYEDGDTYRIRLGRWVGNSGLRASVESGTRSMARARQNKVRSPILLRLDDFH